ncbi:MAG: DNA adenine methylase [Candidatus Sericytochromatia bacterium]|nr:DNA adenine methylase [Candidatus Sericytochromatia bacterium]
MVVPDLRLHESNTTFTVKPFLKWAGGKGQLIEQILPLLPEQLKSGKIETYFEPFIGGGAVFFHIAQKYKINKAVICDVNEELVITYNSIKKDAKLLINELEILKEEYLLYDQENRQLFFYKIREIFNKNKDSFDFKNYSKDWVLRAAQIIFLNKTCFNGLFRVNSKGYFNVPSGRYNNPAILDVQNLINISNLLNKINTEIIWGDFEIIDEKVNKNDFVYLDPPYRPLNQTSSFKSYSKFDFNDKEQTRLRDFFTKLDKKGAKLMLSNSDPRNENPNDNFFDEIYNEFRIERVFATRMINSNAEKRGKISEILVMNY